MRWLLFFFASFAWGKEEEEEDACRWPMAKQPRAASRGTWGGQCAPTPGGGRRRHSAQKGQRGDTRHSVLPPSPLRRGVAYPNMQAHVGHIRRRPSHDIAVHPPPAALPCLGPPLRCLDIVAVGIPFWSLARASRENEAPPEGREEPRESPGLQNERAASPPSLPLSPRRLETAKTPLWGRHFAPKPLGPPVHKPHHCDVRGIFV